MNKVRSLYYDGSSVPTAFVTKGRQRVKQYNNDTVYLNNGDEFEIELFNPTTNKVLAKIELNGVSMGSGIVLRPGERVFLERYLNEAKKFLFEIYEVDGNNPNVQKAIADNGKVDVKFYSETLNNYWNDCWSYTTTYPPYIPTYPPYIPTITYTAHSGKHNIPTYGMTSGDVIGQGSVSAQCFGSLNPVSTGEVHCFNNSVEDPVKNIETGRVEKGSNSNQSFTNDNTSFNSWWSWSSVWKIFPLSYKPLETRDLKVFCTSCGAKQKKHTFKFCPNCGTKY
jgi:hypothetical protein